MRELKIQIDVLLSLIACAQDYGFNDGVLFDEFAEMMGRKLSDEEIERFAREIESSEGYTEEDYHSIYETLQDFKKYYIED